MWGWLHMPCDEPFIGSFLFFPNHQYSQARIKETHWAMRKGFRLSIVSLISCPINVESLTCIKSEE